MDFERLRQTLAARQDAHHQAVSVNQRHLIDKILARYSAEYTVYREVLQNGNDAGATAMHVSFDTIPPDSTKVKTVTLKNNGRPFTEADWSRLMSIAEGNPDEQKIGFFGVGFYSLFSICEEPMVVSGGKCLSFYWQRDQLYSRCIETDSDAEWTTIYLSLREPIDCPNMDSLAQFMAKSLLFTVSLESVEVTVDRRVMFAVTRRTSPEQPLPVPNNAATKPHGVFTLATANIVTVQLSLDKRYSSEPESKGFFNDLWRMTRESLSKNSDLYDQVRRPGTFNMFCRVFRAKFGAQLPKKVYNEMERVTKKRPPQHVTVSCLYSSFQERVASDATTAHEKVKHPVLDGVLPSAQQGGHVFIGFETHQTTGLAVHCSAPFIPTVERETIDFVDSAVRHWNQELVGAVGLMARLIWDYELREELKTGGGASDYQKSADHLIRSFAFANTAPLPVIADLLKAHFLTGPELMVPTSVGVRPVTSLRIIPDDMQPFLKQTPQPIGHCQDFYNLIALVSGVRQAGAEDLLAELRVRPFNIQETISAIRWCLKHHDDISEQLGHLLLSNLKLPCGPERQLLPLTKAKYVVLDDNINWTIPTDCITADVSKLMTVQEWHSLSVNPIPTSRWLQSHLERCEKSASVFEDIFVVLSQQTLSDSELAICCSLLSDIACIPTGNSLRKPQDVFLEDVLSFGAASLPTVSFKRRHLIHDSILKAVGVRSHLPCHELLGYFDQRSSDADRAKLLSYLSKIQEDLTRDEFERVKQTPIFGEGRWCVKDLHRDGKAARLIGLPVLVGVDLADERMVHLLRRLDFRFFIPLNLVVEAMSKEHKWRITLYEYLFEHAEYYKKDLLANPTIKMVWCEDGQLRANNDCYTDPRVAVLGLPVVKGEVARFCEHYLHVCRRPAGSTIVSILRRNDNITVDPNVMEFLADCEYTDSDHRQLSTLKLINNQTATPAESFFKVSADFARLFTMVDHAVYEGKPRVKQFLSVIGVREEPHANELMLACAANPLPLLESLGVKRYTALLRLFAVHMEAMTEEAISRFKRGHALLGIIDGADGPSAALYNHNSVFIGDDAITQRQFSVPVAPAGDDLHGLYVLMGCQRVSDLVETSWMADRPEPATDPTLKRVIVERSRILVKDALHINEACEEAIRSLRSLSLFQCRRINVTKSWNGTQKQLTTTAAYDPSTHRLLHTTTPPADPFDLAQAVVHCVAPFHEGRRQVGLSETLLVSTLMTMPVEALVERGFSTSGFDGVCDESDGDEEIDINIGGVDDGVKSPPSVNTQSPAAPTLPKAPPVQQPPPPVEEKLPKPKLFEKILSVFGADWLKPNPKTPQNRQQSLDDLLRQGVQASRPNAGATVNKDTATRPPPIAPAINDAAGECVIPNDLVCVGRLASFEYYARPGHPNPPTNVTSLVAHLNTLSTVFRLPPSTLHIFHDPTSRSIAFNRSGSLFFNAHHAHQPLPFWYMTACHELAHNFWGPHDERHEHYMMSYAERYLGNLIPFL